MNKLAGLGLLLLFAFQSWTQARVNTIQNDSVAMGNKTGNVLVKRMVLPASLITASAFLNHSPFEDKVKSRIQDKVGIPSSFEIEDYLQYVPIGELYLADAARIPAKNDWFHQTLNLCLADFASTLITSTLKEAFHKTRPNGGTLSFPSGHTTFSFTNASVLYYEFRETSSILAYSGFGFSTATGALRMVHNKHWLSDVMVGAGIGMAVTTLVYTFDPFQNWHPFHTKHSATLMPAFQNHSAGFYFAMQF